MVCGAGKRALPSSGAFLGLGAVAGDFMCQSGEATVPGERGSDTVPSCCGRTSQTGDSNQLPLHEAGRPHHQLAL